MEDCHRDQIRSWLKKHLGSDYDIEQDRYYPNWLCTVNKGEDSFVVCLEESALDSFVVVAMTVFPDCAEDNSERINGLLQICNSINGCYLGAECEVHKEDGLGVVMHSSIPVQLFMEISDDSRYRFLTNSFQTIREIRDTIKSML